MSGSDDISTAGTGTTGMLANALGFQLVWFGCVYGAGRGLPWLGPLLALGFAALVLRFGGHRQDDLRMLRVALPLGFLIDTAWLSLGWLDYPAPWPVAGIAPAWIMALWLGFALTLNHSLASLRRRPVLAALLGALGGPLAYLGAARLFQAVTLHAPHGRIMLALALAWAAALPLLYLLADGGRRRTERVPA